MARRKKRVGRVRAMFVLAMLTALVMSASAGAQLSAPSADAALARVVGGAAATGGTVRLGATRACDSLDPAQSFDSWCGVISRLYSRTLLAYAGKPGTDGLIVVPDLATDLPEVSADRKEWTFHLRSSVKWDDGSAVTTADVRYSVQRLFDRTLAVAVPTSILCLLSDCPGGVPTYAGSGDLASIITPDNRTVTFRLNRSYPDFDKVVAMPQFAPISKARAKVQAKAGAPYAAAPAADGPFSVVKVTADQVVFKRNDTWRQSSDKIRRPWVDSFTLQIYADDTALAEAISGGLVDLKVNLGLDTAAATAVAAIPGSGALLDHPLLSTTDFLAVNPKVAPMDNIACRKAVFYALDRSSLVALRGENAVAAGGMVPPLVPGYTTNPSMSGKATGQPERARSLLAECGRPDGFELTMAYPNFGIGPAQFESVRESLAAVGIVVNSKPFATAADYFTTGIGSPEAVDAEGIGLLIAAWGPSFASALDYWSPLVDGRKIAKVSNLNYASVSEPRIADLLDQLETVPGADGTAISSAINRITEQMWVYLPISYPRITLYRPAYFTHIYVQQALGGQYDLVNLAFTAASQQ